MRYYKYIFSSTYPDGKYWERLIDIPVDIAVAGFSASDLVRPAREFFPPESKDVPLAQLSFRIVKEEEITKPIPKLYVWNTRNRVGWFEVNCSQERIASFVEQGYLTLAFPQPVPTPKKIIPLLGTLGFIGAVMGLVYVIERFRKKLV